MNEDEPMPIPPYTVGYREAGIFFRYIQEDLLVDAVTEASYLAQSIPEHQIEIHDSIGMIVG